LRGILVRVVRTSTEDANRRQFPRYALKLGVEASDSAGKALEAALIDVSEGGANLRTSTPLRVGERGDLRLAGYPKRLAFRVKAVEAGNAHVEFAQTADEAAEFRAWLAPRVTGLTPVK
jgi:aerotaxis receptor